MAVHVQASPGEKPVKKVRVQIGEEWCEHHFGRPVPRAEAAQRARQMLEALA